ncbi:unnamed protein product [Penicillium roqueforti FM164]|uniref:Genomic scaffold, ProqFM164S04 n=1 Tax=Penicillium roqueforti (strain FM164) TaxID=1365484 RepID=W6R0G3_PENRF|nr:unnamed protein product [Penicillium roqueforti FM164]
MASPLKNGCGELDLTRKGNQWCVKYGQAFLMIWREKFQLFRLIPRYFDQSQSLALASTPFY